MLKVLVFTLLLSSVPRVAHADGLFSGLGDFVSQAYEQVQQTPQDQQRAPQQSDASTSDSSVLVNATVPTSAKWVEYVVARYAAPPAQSQDLQSYIKSTSGGPISQKIYLPGAGYFQVQIFYSNQADRYKFQVPSGPSGQMANAYGYIGEITVQNTDTRDLENLGPSPDVQSDSPEIQALAQTITQGKTTDHDKSVAIHNWIAENIKYDAKDYFAGVYPMGDALTTLHAQMGVCEGYANLNSALHRAAGIRARAISGSVYSLIATTDAAESPGSSAQKQPDPLSCTAQTPNHRWNEILLDGVWQIQDSTWDAGYVDASTQLYTEAPRNKYLFPAANDFALDHLKCSVVSN